MAKDCTGCLFLWQPKSDVSGQIYHCDRRMITGKQVPPWPKCKITYKTVRMINDAAALHSGSESHEEAREKDTVKVPGGNSGSAGKKPTGIGHDEQIKKLYDMGYSDREITEELLLPKNEAFNWRRRNKLPPNKAQESNRMELYQLGLNDREIAEELNVDAGTIKSWRRRNGLKANYKDNVLSEEERENRIALYHMGLTDSEIARRIGRGRSAINAWRQKLGLPKNSRQTEEKTEEDV